MSRLEKLRGMASSDAIQTLFAVEKPAQTELVHCILKRKLPRDRKEHLLSFATGDSKAANPTIAVRIRYKFSCRLRLLGGPCLRLKLKIDSFELERRDGTIYCGDGRYRRPSAVA